MQRLQVFVLWNKCLDIFQGFIATMNLIQVTTQRCCKKNYLRLSHYSRVSTSRPQRAEAYLLSLDWIHLGRWIIRLMQWTYKRQCQLIWHSGFLGEKMSTIFFPPLQSLRKRVAPQDWLFDKKVLFKEEDLKIGKR